MGIWQSQHIHEMDTMIERSRSNSNFATGGNMSVGTDSEFPSDLRWKANSYGKFTMSIQETQNEYLSILLEPGFPADIQPNGDEVWQMHNIHPRNP